MRAIVTLSPPGSTATVPPRFRDQVRHVVKRAAERGSPPLRSSSRRRGRLNSSKSRRVVKRAALDATLAFYADFFWDHSGIFAERSLMWRKGARMWAKIESGRSRPPNFDAGSPPVPPETHPTGLPAVKGPPNAATLLLSGSRPASRRSNQNEMKAEGRRTGQHRHGGKSRLPLVRGATCLLTSPAVDRAYPHASIRGFRTRREQRSCVRDPRYSVCQEMLGEMVTPRPSV